MFDPSYSSAYYFYILLSVHRNIYVFHAKQYGLIQNICNYYNDVEKATKHILASKLKDY